MSTLKFTIKNILAFFGNISLVLAFLSVPLAAGITDESNIPFGYAPFVLLIASIVLRKHAEEEPLSAVIGLLFMGVTSFLAFVCYPFFAAVIVIVFWVWEHFYTRALRKKIATKKLIPTEVL